MEDFSHKALVDMTVPTIIIEDPTVENVLKTINQQYIDLGPDEIGGRNILLKHSDGDVLTFCSMHPSRTKLLKIYLKQMIRNKADVMWNVNNIPKNLPSQCLGEIHSEEYFEHHSDYKWYWSLHSDIIPPPFAAERMTSHGVDIISGIVPKPFVPEFKRRRKGAYIGYTSKNMKRRRGHCWPEMFCYNLIPGNPTEYNPHAKLLDYDQQLFEVVSLGWGCLMLSKKAIQEVGYHKLGGKFNITRGPLDTLWNKYVFKRGLFKKYVDTTVRCRHLSHSIQDEDAAEPWKKREEVDPASKQDWITEDWYGWSLEDEK